MYICVLNLCKVSLLCYGGEGKGKRRRKGEVKQERTQQEVPMRPHNGSEARQYHFSYSVWPKILAGRYFGGLLKIYVIGRIYFGVKPVLAIMIFIAKWLIKRTGNLTGP